MDLDIFKLNGQLFYFEGIMISGQLKTLMKSKIDQNSGQAKSAVLGASGGVGGIAVQMLRAEGLEVVATCKNDAFPMIQAFGVDKIIDYQAQDSDRQLTEESPFDLIVDCAGKGAEYANTLPWKFQRYVTFSSPLLKNFDSKGIVNGSLQNIHDLLHMNSSYGGESKIRWGFFFPDQAGIKYISSLVGNNKLKPVIDSVFGRDDLKEAYKKVSAGSLRGKVVIDFNK